MRSVFLRRLASRYGGGTAQRRYHLFPALAGIGLALVLFWQIDRLARPVVIELAGAKLQNAVTEIVNDAVGRSLEEGDAGDGLFAIQTDQNGTITTLTANPAALNRLRGSILADVLERVRALDRETLGIPIGNLTGWGICSGRGPVLSVQVLAAAVPRAEFRNEFTAAGINQTLHQVMLDVTVEVSLLLPGGRAEYIINVPVCVTETVIIGQVPDTYLNLPCGYEKERGELS